MVHTGSRGSDDRRVLCLLPVFNYDHLAGIHSGLVGSIGILVIRRVDGIQIDPRMSQTGWIQCIVCSRLELEIYTRWICTRSGRTREIAILSKLGDKLLYFGRLVRRDSQFNGRIFATQVQRNVCTSPETSISMVSKTAYYTHAALHSGGRRRLMGRAGFVRDCA